MNGRTGHFFFCVSVSHAMASQWLALVLVINQLKKFELMHCTALLFREIEETLTESAQVQVLVSGHPADPRLPPAVLMMPAVRSVQT